MLTLLFAGVPLVQAQAPLVSGDNGAVGGIFGAKSINLGSMLGTTGKSYSSSSIGGISGVGVPVLGSLLPKLAGKGSGLSGLLGALGKGGDMALDKAIGGAFGSKGAEGVTGNTLTPEQWAHPGTGRYPAKYFTGISSNQPGELFSRFRPVVAGENNLRTNRYTEGQHQNASDCLG
jgi:hypothetical protein